MAPGHDQGMIFKITVTAPPVGHTATTKNLIWGVGITYTDIPSLFAGDKVGHMGHGAMLCSDAAAGLRQKLPPQPTQHEPLFLSIWNGLVCSTADGDWD
jgi:hypothetical protein